MPDIVNENGERVGAATWPDDAYQPDDGSAFRRLAAERARFGHDRPSAAKASRPLTPNEAENAAANAERR
jgi:hypothetical protein